MPVDLRKVKLIVNVTVNNSLRFLQIKLLTKNLNFLKLMYSGCYHSFEYINKVLILLKKSFHKIILMFRYWNI